MMEEQQQHDNNQQHSSAITMPTTTTASVIIVNYRHRQSMFLGVWLIIVGVLSIVFNIIDICFIDQVGWIVFITGNGFWGGTMFTVAGSFGIASSRNRTRLSITTFMLLNVLSSFLALEQLVVGVRASVWSDHLCRYKKHSADLREQDADMDDNSCQLGTISRAMGGCLAVMALFGSIASIWSLVICCRAVGYCSSTSVSYYNSASGGSVQQDDELQITSDTVSLYPKRAKQTYSDTISRDQGLRSTTAAEHHRSLWEPRDPANVVPSFSDVQSLFLGVALIVNGILSIVFNVIDISFVDQVEWFVIVTGNGFWGGTTGIIAGIAAIAASRNRTRLLITTLTAFAVISTCLAFQQFVVGIRGSIWASHLCRYEDPFNADTNSSCSVANVTTAMEACLAVVAVPAAAASVWCLVVCFKAVGCCAADISNVSRNDDAENNHQTAGDSGIDQTPTLSVTVYEPAIIANYRHRQSMFLGVCLIIVGALSVIFNIVDICFIDQVGWIVFVTGNGFWGGTMFIISGGVGVSASRNKSRLAISTFMVLCILSSFLALEQFVIGIRGTLWAVHLCRYHHLITGEDYCHVGYVTSIMEACLAAMAGVAGIASVWSVIISAKAVGCCSLTSVSTFGSISQQVTYELQPETSSSSPVTLPAVTTTTTTTTKNSHLVAADCYVSI
jgi:hypothetical protein